MQHWACRTPALAVTMLFASCVSAAAQVYAAREKLRAQSNQFRKDVIRVTDGVYVAVGYSASNVILIQLLYTPGETADAISVWLPEKRVLMPGDDFLHAFPNISPIRGARTRTPEDWIASLEKMIERYRGCKQELRVAVNDTSARRIRFPYLALRQETRYSLVEVQRVVQ